MAEYILHINLDNGLEIINEKDEAQKQLENFNDPNKTNTVTTKEIPFKNTVTGLAVIQGAQIAKDIVTDMVSYRLNTVGVRYGDTATQNRINNIMNGVNKVGGIVSATAAGAVAGSVIPVVGTAVGAALGFISSVSSEIVQMVQRMDEWDRNQQINNLNERRTSERLGLLSTDRNR